jgi:hypothetical protein
MCLLLVPQRALADMTEMMKDLRLRNEYRLFSRNAIGALSALVFIHWLPDIYVWTNRNVLARNVVINNDRYGLVTGVADILTGVCLLIGVVGLIRISLASRQRQRDSMGAR